jgi:hypothetical protein
VRFVEGFDRNNSVDEEKSSEKIKDVYEDYAKLNPYQSQRSSTDREATHHQHHAHNAPNHDHTSIFGKTSHNTPSHRKPLHKTKTRNAFREQDYMTMNEPKGPELKYHQLKKLRNKIIADTETNATKSQQEPFNQPRAHPNKGQKMNNEQDRPDINEFDPTPPSFKYRIHEKITITDDNKDNLNEAEKDIPKGPGEEFEEFFKHNSKGIDQFIKDREKYGNYFGDTKIEDDESVEKEEQEKEKKKEEKEKAEKRNKNKEKQEPTPEDVDRNARKYIKQFIFKIHPDFFHQDAAKKSASIHFNLFSLHFPVSR